MLDIFSGISLLFLFVGMPILANYYPNSRDENGHLTWPVLVMFIDAPFAFFGFIWLVSRYSLKLHRKYPFTANQSFRTIVIVLPAALIVLITALLGK